MNESLWKAAIFGIGFRFSSESAVKDGVRVIVTVDEGTVTVSSLVAVVVFVSVVVLSRILAAVFAGGETKLTFALSPYPQCLRHQLFRALFDTTDRHHICIPVAPDK